MTDAEETFYCENCGIVDQVRTVPTKQGIKKLCNECDTQVKEITAETAEELPDGQPLFPEGADTDTIAMGDPQAKKLNEMLKETGVGKKKRGFITKIFIETPTYRNYEALYMFLNTMALGPARSKVICDVTFAFPHPTAGGQPPPQGAVVPMQNYGYQGNDGKVEKEVDEFEKEYNSLMKQVIKMQKLKLLQQFPNMLDQPTSAPRGGMQEMQIPLIDPETGAQRVSEQGFPMYETRWAPVGGSGGATDPMMMMLFKDMIDRGREKGQDSETMAGNMVKMLETGVNLAKSNTPPPHQDKSLELITAINERDAKAREVQIESQARQLEEMRIREMRVVEKRLEDMSPESQAKQIEVLRKAGMFGGDQNIEIAKLNARLSLATMDRADAKDLESMRIHADREEKARAQDTINSAINLGAEVVREIGQGVGQTLGERAKQGMQSQGQGPTPAVNMTPEQRAEVLQKINEMESQLDARKKEVESVGE